MPYKYEKEIKENWFTFQMKAMEISISIKLLYTFADEKL